MSLRKKPHRWVSVELPDKFNPSSMEWRCVRCSLHRLRQKVGIKSWKWFYGIASEWKSHNLQHDLVPPCEGISG